MGDLSLIDELSLVTKYLNRLGFTGEESRTPDLGWLSELQAAHMIHVPFENLDVFHRRGVTTDLEHSLDKVINRRRGGWCFELNGAFGWLLSELGFETSYVSCRVFGDGAWGPELDHCGLVVQIDDVPTYVDVGFGDNCMVPIPLTEGLHNGVPRQIECKIDEDSFVLSELQLDGTWTESLWGSYAPLPLSAFTPRSHFLQTEPGLSWTEKPFATRATAADGSRVTLRRKVLKQRRQTGEFTDAEVTEDEWTPLLGAHFDMIDTAAS